MIKIFLGKLTPEGVNISGEEAPEFLEIENDDNIYSVEPVHYELIAQFVNNGVLVTGQLYTTLICRCAKCLEKYEFHIKNNKVCHLYEKVNKNEIDLTDDIREDILILLPQRFLCSSSCEGICFNCGQNLNLQKCLCSKISEEENVWQKLDNLKL